MERREQGRSPHPLSMCFISVGNEETDRWIEAFMIRMGSGVCIITTLCMSPVFGVPMREE